MCSKLRSLSVSVQIFFLFFHSTAYELIHEKINLQTFLCSPRFLVPVEGWKLSVPTHLNVCLLPLNRCTQMLNLADPIFSKHRGEEKHRIPFGFNSLSTVTVPMGLFAQEFFDGYRLNSYGIDLPFEQSQNFHLGGAHHRSCPELWGPTRTFLQPHTIRPILNSSNRWIV